MKLKDKISEDIKIALKGKDKARLTLLRSLKSALQKVEIDERKELTNQEEQIILSQQMKSREQAKELYIKGNRTDLASIEQNEIDMIAEYLPKKLTKEEMEREVDSAISELNATSIKDMGKVMKTLKDSLGTTADGKLLSQIVKEKLR